jgi:ABC-type dipeptide/oligopeptide/nickel transport system permease component
MPPLMALTMYGGFFIVLVNAFADVVLTRLDPRIVVE